ncbi:TonB-dependent receptor [Parahaliea aestuarii]
MQDIGVAVSGVTADSIENLGVKNFDDLIQNVVGISNVRTQQNSNNVQIRGIANDLSAFYASSNVISFYVDDVSVTATTGQRDFGVVDLDRVEIIRGAQPTLFGEGAVGGVIRYFTADPDLASENVTGTVHASMESIDGGGYAKRIDGATNFVLNPDKLAVRLSAYGTEDDGFIYNRLADEEEANGFESYGGRAVVLARPTDNLEVRLSAFVARDEYELDSQIQVGTDPEDAIYGLAGFADGSFPDFIGEGQDDFDLFSGRLTYNWDQFELTSITGYYTRDIVADSLSVGNTLGLAPFFPTVDTTTFTSITNESEMFSQEFRLVSNFDGPLNFTSGLYYRDRDVLLDESLVSPGIAAVTEPTTSNIFTSTSANESEQFSVFVEATYELTEALRLIGGVRYVDDTYTSEIVFNETINFIPSNGPWTEDNPIGFVYPAEVLDIAGVPGPYEFELNEYLPHVGVEFDVQDNMLLYANVAKGIRNGGVGQAIAALAAAGDENDPNFAQNFANELFYDDDSVVTIDAGFKSTWLEGNLLVNMSAFHTEFKDTQITIQSPATSVTNGPDQRLIGVELETQYVWNSNLTTFFNATAMDTEFEGDFSITGLGVDIEKGDRAVNAPKLSFATGYTYIMAIGDSGWNLKSSGAYQYIGSRYSSNQNFPSTELDSIENLNLRLGFEKDGYSVMAYVSNALNDIEAVAKGPAAVSASRDENGVALDAPLNSLAINRPRAFGVSFRVDF